MKALKKILYPNLAFVIVLFPIAIGLVTYSLVKSDVNSFLKYFSYVLSFYSLLIVCLRIPNIINYVKKIKKENKLISRYFEDVQFRINISLYGQLLWNTAYAVFQLILGLTTKSFWFYTMACYYILLASIRLFLSKHTKKYKPGELIEVELKKYNLCGWLLLVMNFIVSIMIFFFIYLDKNIIHGQIITIGIATYTFITFSLAIKNAITYRKYNSPVYSAAKIINLLCGCVSMMTLTVTMLTTFGGEDSATFNKVIMFITGAAVSIFILLMAIIMIKSSSKKLKEAY